MPGLTKLSDQATKLGCRSQILPQQALLGARAGEIAVLAQGALQPLVGLSAALCGEGQGLTGSQKGVRRYSSGVSL